MIRAVADTRFRLERAADTTWVRSVDLESVPGVAHAFSTAIGRAGERFDCGAADDRRPDVLRRRAELCRAAGLPHGTPQMLAQVHGDRVVRLGPTGIDPPPQADAVVALRADYAQALDRAHVPAVRTADCVPVLLAERRGRAVGAIHAGWRGTARHVVVRAVESLGALGIPAADLVAALGPAIGPCCYRVGEEVVSAVAGAGGGPPVVFREGREGATFLDLRQAVRAQLERAGLASSAIHAAPWCTACERELLFSHRRQGPTGRLMACIGFTPETDRS